MPQANYNDRNKFIDAITNAFCWQLCLWNGLFIILLAITDGLGPIRVSDGREGIALFIGSALCAAGIALASWRAIKHNSEHGGCK